MAAEIQVIDIKKTFTLTRNQMKKQNLVSRKITAVDGLTFSVCKGEVLGVLGANGAGKTTTLRMIAGLLQPDSGQIIVNDTEANPERSIKQIGFLTNDMKLDGYFTPDYLFDFFAGLHNIESQKAARRKQELFEKFGINRYKHLRINELSTGMKQKVSLVISVVHDPRIIIYDEPTNGLDIIASKTVEEYLFDLHNEGKTIVISTHILSLVEKLCNRIVIIKNGSLVDDAQVPDILKEQSVEDYFYKKYRD